MKKTKTITLQDEKVEINKIPIGKFSELMLAIDKLPSIVTKAVSFEELENINEQLILTKLPSILAQAQDDILNLVHIASGVEKIEELDFEEFVDVITAVVEINNIQSIVTKVKNLGKVLQTKAG